MSDDRHEFFTKYLMIYFQPQAVNGNIILRFINQELLEGF
jgi:hypothetical protein